MKYCGYCGSKLLFPHSKIGVGGILERVCSNLECRIGVVSYAPIHMGADSDTFTYQLEEDLWKENTRGKEL